MRPWFSSLGEKEKNFTEEKDVTVSGGPMEMNVIHSVVYIYNYVHIFYILTIFTMYIKSTNVEPILNLSITSDCG